LTTAGQAGATAALWGAIPLPALAEWIAQDPRISTTPVLDKGFASARRIGEGVYATLSDTSKGVQTMCNGGFIAGRDGALLFEGHYQPAGAAFELEALRMVTQAPVRGAINSHYHFDHTFGNAFYGAQGIPVWAHAKTQALMHERYALLQGKARSEVLSAAEKGVREAKSDAVKQHAESDLRAMTFLAAAVENTVLAMPNKPLEPAKLPMQVDLGGLTVSIEAHPGHTPTDLVARIPEQNVTFAGDLIFNGSYPVSFDADMPAWRNVMRTFAGYGADALFVPGHGQLCGQEGIARLAAVIDDLGEQSEKLFQAGVPVREAVHRYAIPEKFKSLGMFAWGFCIGGAVESYYASFQKAKAPAKAAKKSGG
jgi:glyoxylase-like metal-dependent hydrolase (beta-lactamase superfamily II)